MKHFVNRGASSSSAPVSTEENVFNHLPSIFQLSDEVLLMILELLSTRDLLNVFRTCKRLQGLCYEKKFWHRIEIENPHDKNETLNLVFNTFLSAETTRLSISSTIPGNNVAHRSSFCPSYFALLNPPPPPNPLPGVEAVPTSCLTHLSLIRQRIDGKLFTLDLLPKSLRVLDLTGTFLENVTEETAYFKGISESLEQLEELYLRDCTWVTSHSLLPISKCPALVHLSLRGCREIGNCIAYVALSSRFGFKTLKVLDVTDTKVGSTDVLSFAAIPNLEEFYFGQYDLIDADDHHQITDQCIAVFSNLPQLKVIDLSGSMVTDGCIETLRTVPNLTKVIAHFTQLTEAGISRLQSALPACTLHKSSVAI